MRYLTLVKTWRLCLLEWAWIIMRLAEDPSLSVEDLKEEWFHNNAELIKQELGTTDIRADCFFCEYDERHEGHCLSCPGRLVDEMFCCAAYSYNYRLRPQDFFEKITALHKKWQRRKKAG